MKLRPATQTENYPIAHLESDLWEMGIYPVIYGFRVRAGRKGSSSVDVDYCAGDEIEALIHIYCYVFLLLSSLEESTTSDELSAMLPKYQCKPIQNDPQCWEKLSALINDPPLEHQKAFAETIMQHWIQDGIRWSKETSDPKACLVLLHFIQMSNAVKAHTSCKND